MSEYHRASGAPPGGFGRIPTRSGIPPRGRGCHNVLATTLDKLRNTTARAGWPCALCTTLIQSPEYHRSGGAAGIVVVIGYVATGIPPRERGYPSHSDRQGGQRRITTARAGPPSRHLLVSPISSEYHRVGGVCQWPPRMVSVGRGSPPRGRGGCLGLMHDQRGVWVCPCGDPCSGRGWVLERRRQKACFSCSGRRGSLSLYQCSSSGDSGRSWCGSWGFLVFVFSESPEFFFQLAVPGLGL